MVRANKPRSPETIERVQRLVAAAVGLDPARGDQLTVENIAFGDQVTADEPPPGPFWKELPRQVAPFAPQLLRIVVVIGLALVAILMVLRPMMRATFGTAALPAAAAAGLAPRTVAEMEGALDASIRVAAKKCSQVLLIATYSPHV